MKITIAQLKQNNLISKTGGRSLTQIPNLYGIIQEVLFEMMSNISLPSAIRIETLSNPTTTEPTRWKAPADLDLEALIDIYPVDYRNNATYRDIGTYKSDFIRSVMNNRIVLEHINGEQYFSIGRMLDTDVLDTTHNIEYYSNSVVFDTTGVRRENNLPVLDTDYILLNTSEFNIFLKEFSLKTGVDIKPASSNTEINVYGGNLKNLYDNFKFNYPSRKILISNEY